MDRQEESEDASLAFGEHNCKSIFCTVLAGQESLSDVIGEKKENSIPLCM